MATKLRTSRAATLVAAAAASLSLGLSLFVPTAGAATSNSKPDYKETASSVCKVDSGVRICVRVQYAANTNQVRAWAWATDESQQSTNWTVDVHQLNLWKGFPGDPRIRLGPLPVGARVIAKKKLRTTNDPDTNAGRDDAYTQPISGTTEDHYIADAKVLATAGKTKLSVDVDSGYWVRVE